MSHPLSDFLAAHDWDRIKRVNGWRLSRRDEDPDILIFELQAMDGEEYRALVECSGYPDQAPSVVFVNDKGSASDPRAWPKGTGRFHEVVKPPPHCFLCMPLIREGLAHHGDWRDNPRVRAWNSQVHTLMDVLNYLQRLLHSQDYQGRGLT